MTLRPSRPLPARPLVVLLAAGALLVPLAASAQGKVASAAPAWPDKPVRLIVPFPPGGATDVLARVVANRMGETFGQPVLIDNRPGASGNIGAEIVARAQADGYTLLVNTTSVHTMNPALFEKMPFRPVDDFAPISLLAYVANALVVHPSLKANDVKELIALAKAAPGRITYASAGMGSTNHLSAALFSRLAGVELLHVPYKGGGPAVADTVAGNVQVMFTGMNNIIEHVKNGRLRLLGVTDARRSPAAPAAAPLNDLLPGMVLTVYYGMLAPAGTPRDIVNRVNAETNRIMEVPDVRTRLAALGMEPSLMTPAQFGELLRDDLKRWTKIIREAGIKGE